MSKIHIQVWSGGSACITDMTNAGKRGKTCQVASFQGWYNTTCGHSETHPEAAKAHQQTGRVLAYLTKLAIGELNGTVNHLVNADFKTVVAEVEKIVADKDHTLQVKVYMSEIKGINAPKPKLLAGVEGKWCGGADEGGISLSDLTDHYNEPRMITHNQTNARAYEIAAKVWEQVKNAASFHEAGDILRNAGARLHYYCAMD